MACLALVLAFLLQAAPASERPVGESEPHAMSPDDVPDPFNRYARIIFPLPPPR